jgi:hypothetical protein
MGFTQGMETKMDILGLYIVLFTVVVWITGNLTWVEIEKLKTDKKGSVANEIGPDLRMRKVTNRYEWINLDNQQEDFKHEESTFIEPELWGIPNLEPGEVYYLCHPCTTGGKTVEENKAKEEELYRKIMKRNPGAKVIRPLAIIPNGLPHGKAMKKCFKLMGAADAIILPIGWEESDGCQAEYDRAMEKGMDRIYLIAN